MGVITAAGGVNRKKLKEAKTLGKNLTWRGNHVMNTGSVTGWFVSVLNQYLIQISS